MDTKYELPIRNRDRWRPLRSMKRVRSVLQEGFIRLSYKKPKSKIGFVQKLVKFITIFFSNSLLII
ncbi:hypothetical protein Mucpa_2883 [Mucilaginibacter paludis DSM 18603]|uniref:Uncharacterized protein n=1 Tax=Mucilaginibacter paludis DSM 18603 TaxID=714943 RepID=H1YAE9_9SPHI|nr:hypothetical protein Mucpa_2883 [Mucilaginibacter paludis DSM 18603]